MFKCWWRNKETWSTGTSLAHTVGFEPENQQKHAVRRQLILFAVFFFKMENMPVPHFCCCCCCYSWGVGSIPGYVRKPEISTTTTTTSQNQLSHWYWSTKTDKPCRYRGVSFLLLFFGLLQVWVKFYLTWWQRKGWGYRGSTVETDLHSAARSSVSPTCPTWTMKRGVQSTRNSHVLTQHNDTIRFSRLLQTVKLFTVFPSRPQNTELRQTGFVHVTLKEARHH